MNGATTVILVLAAFGQQAGEGAHKAQTATRAKSQRLLELHTDEAASYSIYRDVWRTQKLELLRKPVYRWTYPTRSGGQMGEGVK